MADVVLTFDYGELLMLMTPKNVYRRFIQFEERAADLYLSLASRFSKDPDLSSFWFDMAMQEKQHAGLLQFCLRDNLFAPKLPDSKELQKLTDLFTRVEKGAQNPKLSVTQAFRLAIELEVSEINTIYCRLTETLHASVYLFRRKIAMMMPNHADELLAAARKFGVPEQSLQELSRITGCSG